MLRLLIPPIYNLKTIPNTIWRMDLERGGSRKYSDYYICVGLEYWQKPKDQGYEKKGTALSSILEEQAMGLGHVLDLKIGER